MSLSLFSAGCCKSVKPTPNNNVDSKAVTEYLGRYEATGEEEEDAPVYRNSHGIYLYRHSDGTWRADERIGGDGLYSYRSVGTAECPDSISQWNWKSLYNVIHWESSDITVQCT